MYHVKKQHFTAAERVWLKMVQQHTDTLNALSKNGGYRFTKTEKSRKWSRDNAFKMETPKSLRITDAHSIRTSDDWDDTVIH